MRDSIQLSKGVDTGDVILRKKTGVTQEDTLHSLQQKIAFLGGEALIDGLDMIEKGSVERLRQVDKGSYYAFPARSDVKKAMARGIRII